MGEDDFLRSILENPRDDARRLVYADWLDERGDSVSVQKSEFLRLTVQRSRPPRRRKWGRHRQRRLQKLAAQLDTEWLAVVSAPPIENCAGKRARAGSRIQVPFSFLCDRRWEDLRPSDDRTVRFCDACRQNVHFCDTITEARSHASDGHCVAVDLGVIRREGDLEGWHWMLGRVSVEMLRAEEELMRPDPVSAERERRKRERAEAEL
jgi:uncharacterized protein (TIGR02996 family)